MDKDDQPPRAWKALSAAGYLLMAAAVLALLATHSLFAPSPAVIAVQSGAVILMGWARATFGRRSFHATANPTEGGLVTSGPYRFIRHPIYTSACVFAWAGALAHLSVGALSLASLMLVGALIRIAVEERLLAERYPEYREYAARTKRMIPYVF